MANCDGLRCPLCRAQLDVAMDQIGCGGCGQLYPRVGGIPVLLPKPAAHLALWRSQLGLLLERGQATLTRLQEASRGEGVAASTQERLVKLGEAVQAQVNDVGLVLGPALGGAVAPGSVGLPRGVVEYIAYLYRDWGWPTVGYAENERALGELKALNQGRALGRTLVLGAGACGLAYDLHRSCAATETVLVDIDPFLLVIAERVVRGERVHLTEASLKVMDVDDVSRGWWLQAPQGPLPESSFQFLFADGVEPPFADGCFDSVVTPWFIDQVPRDLPAFFARLAQLLKPGGRWLNQGPLIYPEQIPFAQRYSRQELFELAANAGFVVDRWSVASMPYLVSPLSGHGKVEAVLSFAATRAAAG